jgi:hypothetical protein
VQLPSPWLQSFIFQPALSGHGSPTRLTTAESKIAITLMVKRIGHLLLREHCMREHNVHFFKKEMITEDEKKF